MLEITLAIVGGIGRAGSPPPPRAKQGRSSPPQPAPTQPREPDHMSDIEWLHWFTDRLEPRHRTREENDRDGFWPPRPEGSSTPERWWKEWGSSVHPAS